jgi:hypothetical protein
MEDRATQFGLRGFIVDPTSARFDWASARCPNGVRLDRLIQAMEPELSALRPVALGIMMPTWIPIAHRASAICEARDVPRALELNTLFRELRARVDQLRVFVHWRTFVDAPTPKLYLWEAFGPEQATERDLSALLTSFAQATAVPEYGEAPATEDVLSLVGALLLRAGVPARSIRAQLKCDVSRWRREVAG